MKMKKRKLPIMVAISTSIFLIMTLTIVQTVFAINELGLFELDRNAIDDSGVPLPDDWETLYDGGGSSQDFTGIIEDISAPGTQFQGGGSKDDLDISSWLWKAGEPLDKDDITNAYAAAYINTVESGDNHVGDLIVYFGLDRYANNGSAQVGFWFLQDPSFGLTDIPRSGGFEFSGVHQVGDILVQSNFTNGGVITNISVYQWLGSGGSNGTLDLVFSAQDCEEELSNDPACATVNQASTPSPWPYTPKFGTSGTFPSGSFFEGGINITRLVPDAGCFTGFLAETRSSTPFDSRLKDFAMGSFELCSIDVTKTGDSLSKVGDDVDYTVTIENTGAITLYKDDITDDVLGDITIDGTNLANANVDSNTCGATLAPDATCTITLTREVLGSDPDPLINVVEAIYRGKSDLTGTAVTDSDDHVVNLFQPDIDVDKTGDTLSKVGDDVHYTITLSNNSSDDTPDMVCTAEDSLLGTIFDGVLSLGDEVLNETYTVQPGDPDPLDNTITLECSPVGFANVLTASDSHSVNLFQPAIDIDKTGDTLSKVGDTIEYTITLTNDSSADTPDMVCTAEDTLNGTIFDDVLPLGDTVLNTYYEVQESDPDPLENTVTLTCSPDGFPNVLEETDSHSVNLFQPAIAVDKTGDTLSKVGDDVDYTITLSNNSSADTPAMICTAEDTLLGTVFSGTLPLGDTVINTSRTVLETDPDPLENTVTLTCSPDGFPNVLEESDSHSVNLFQPAIDVDKTGDTLSKEGDDVHYTITLSNNSSPDTPDMVCTAEDTLLGTIFDEVLPLGDTVLTPTYTVQEGDPDPLVNEVTLTCSPDGFDNVLEESDDHSTNLFYPVIDVTKTGDTLSKVGDDVSYTITLTNDSSADTPALDCTAVDTVLGTLFDGILPLGDTVLTPTYTVQPGDPDPLDNTVTLTCSPDGFPNVLEESDSHSVNLFQPAIDVDKTGDAYSKVGDNVNYTITLSNDSSADTPALTCTATDSLLGTLYDGVLPLGDTVLNPTYTVQEGDPDPLVNTVSMTCTVAGFPNVLGPETDDHTTQLFQPAVEVIKTGPTSAHVGDTITYSFTINNLSSMDSPNLVLDSVTDTVLGSLTATASSNGCDPLVSGGSCSFTFDYTIQAGDPNPLVNVVTVHYHPANFPNDITDDDDHSLEIISMLGCTPGFWQGGAGFKLWNQPVLDPQWPNDATQPFETDDYFNDIFSSDTDSRLDGLTMLDLVGTGGTDDWARKAARDMVAAYLNESAFPADFAAESLSQLETMWYAAVAGGDAGLQAFHTTVSMWNSPPGGYCPLP
jgi:uncharacterized repeat protein (TIGR01451 family)